VSNSIRILATATSCALAAPAVAHHPGGAGNTGGAGPINTVSASTLEQGHAVAGVVVNYARFNTLSDDTLIGATASGVEDVHGLNTIQSYALTGAFGLTNDLTIGVYLPYITRTGIRAAEDDGAGTIEVEDHGDAKGLGDISFLGQYRVFNDRSSQTEAALLLGFRAPTGATGRLTRQGDLFDPEFQPGAGSWGGTFGLAVTHRAGPWSFDANVMYELATTGAYDSNLGDQFLYNAAVSYRMVTGAGTGPMFHGAHAHEADNNGHGHAQALSREGPALDIVLELNGIWHEQQVTSGVTNENSGGHTVFASPGLRLSVGDASSFISLGVPIADHVNGIQADADWRMTTGMSIAF
jgi:Putative MetA-pathway of phenol degradation